MIKRLFSDIAASYDRMNRILSLGRDIRWRESAARLVRGRPKRILDLACGTGDFAFSLARRFPDATLTGVDLTPAMLDLARQKNRSPHITFQEGNAQDLAEFKDKALSLVTCAFGFRNFPDPATALREVRRVLEDDGELIVLEFFRPRYHLLGMLTTLWVKSLALIFSSRHTDAYGYLTASMRTTVSESEFAALAANAGFTLAERRFFHPCCTCLRLVARQGRATSDSSL